MAIERLITMCIRSGSNSAMYCLTNLVGMGSRAQLVVFDFMTNLRTSSSETTANVSRLAPSLAGSVTPMVNRIASILL